MDKLDLTVQEVTHLILVAAMLNDEHIAEIAEKSVRATVLKVQAVTKYDNGSIATPAWEIHR